MSNAVVGKRSSLAIVVVERVVVGGANPQQLLPRAALGFRNRRQERRARGREVPEVTLAQIARDEVLDLRDDSSLHLQPQRKLEGLVGLLQYADETDLSGDRVGYVNLERRGTC